MPQINPAIQPLDEREQQAQAAGRLALVLGLIFGTLGFLAATAWRHLNGQPMPYELNLVVLAASAVSVCYGLTERSNRPLRAAQRRILEHQQETLAMQSMLVGLLRDLKPELEQDTKEKTAQAYYTGYATSTKDLLRPTGTGDLLHMKSRNQPSPPITRRP